MKTILFVCVHNAGRSQMAEAILNKFAAERGLAVRAQSAGTMAAESVNPNAVIALAEIGIDAADLTPKLLTQPMVDASDRVVTMGCGVDADACPARIVVSEDWGLDDPAGQDLEFVRKIRDQIGSRCEDLIEELA